MPGSEYRTLCHVFHDAHRVKFRDQLLRCILVVDLETRHATRSTAMQSAFTTQPGVPRRSDAAGEIKFILCHRWGCQEMREGPKNSDELASPRQCSTGGGSDSLTPRPDVHNRPPVLKGHLYRPNEVSVRDRDSKGPGLALTSFGRYR